MQKIAPVRAYQALRHVLVEERKKRGLTQLDVANRLGPGITQSDVSKIERGERRLDAAELIVFARALGTEAKALVAKIEREM